MRRPFLFPLLPPADRQLLGPRRCATMLTPSAIFLASCPRHLQSQRRLQFLSRLRPCRQIHHRPAPPLPPPPHPPPPPPPADRHAPRRAYLGRHVAAVLKHAYTLAPRPPPPPLPPARRPLAPRH